MVMPESIKRMPSVTGVTKETVVKKCGQVQIYAGPPGSPWFENLYLVLQKNGKLLIYTKDPQKQGLENVEVMQQN